MYARKRPAPRDRKLTFREMALLVGRMTKELVRMVDDDVGPAVAG
jgi:hypothetical protein